MNKAIIAAQEFANWLKANGHGDAMVWDAAKVKECGWGSATADAAVCLEGSVQMAEMQVWERGWFKGGMQPVKGVFVEPYSEWLMNFYIEKE